VCSAVLRDESRRRRIAAAGHARSLQNCHYNENVMRAIADRLRPPESSAGRPP
jgi:hypothetical protein